MSRLAVALLGLILTTPLSAFAFLGMNAGATLQGPLPAWTKQFGSRTKKVETRAQSVATDASGNIYVAGYTAADLDGNTVTGTYDFFVTKYDATGAKLWTKTLGVASAFTYGRTVTVDPSGNVFVAGNTTGGLDGNTRTGPNDTFVTKYDSSGTKQWTKQLGASIATNVIGYGVAADPSGNIFVTGITNGSLDGNTHVGGYDLFVTKYDGTGTKQWTREMGVTPGSTYSYGAATDSSGNVFVTGYTQGGLDGNTLTGTYDVYVTKYDATGAKQWTKQLGVASQATYGTGVATDSSGNIIVTGYTTGGLDGNTLTGTQDFFVTKYDSTGAKQWTQQLGVATYSTRANSVTTDSSGNIFVAGYTTGGLDGNTLTGTQDLFVTKYDATGAKQWTQQLGVASQSTLANGVATDPSGNIFTAGSTDGGLDGNTLTGTIDFIVTKYTTTSAKQWTKQLGGLGPVTISNTLTATDTSGNLFVAGTTDGGLDGNIQTGSTDLFITKYDSTGAKQWTKQLGVASYATRANGVTTDSSGNIFVTGYTQGGLDGNTLTGTQDFYVTKYDSTGTKLWTRQLGAAGTATYGNGVATDSAGNVYVAGNTFGSLDGNTLAGNEDLFVTKYDSTGTKLWTKQLGASGVSLVVYGDAIDSSGNVYLAGITNGSFDGNTLTGSQDFFVTKYNSAGTKQWTKLTGVASKVTQASGVATDSSGNIFVAGYTNGGLDGNTVTGTQDFFVTKYDATGAKLWTKQMGVASQSTYATGVATDSFGNAYITGYTHGGLDGNALKGTQDIFATKFTSAGVKQWTKQLGAASSASTAYGIAFNPTGRLYISGITKGNLDFNSLTGGTDAFACQYIGN